MNKIIEPTNFYGKTITSVEIKNKLIDSEKHTILVCDFLDSNNEIIYKDKAYILGVNMPFELTEDELNLLNKE